VQLLTARTRRHRKGPSDSAVKAARRAWGARRAEARAGLVYGPYLTAASRCELRTAAGGACTTLRRKYTRPVPHTWCKPRGLVREFSRRSRTRLQQTLCALPIAHVGRGMLFVTLTYPAEYPGDWRQWKRQLDTWLKRARRRLPAFACVWKLEPQKRGAPHYHLVVVGANFIAKDWLSRSWYEVVDSRDPKHLAAGTQVAQVRSHRGVLSYAAKYVAKQQELPDDWQDGVGRWWGVCNRTGLGVVWLAAPLTQPMYWALLRVFRQLVAHRTGKRDRGPPRAHPAGTWLPLRSEVAAAAWSTALRGAAAPA
jgi:hypothetical protein